MSTRGFARLGMLAVGLGVGAAWAHMPVARPTHPATGCRRSIVWSVVRLAGPGRHKSGTSRSTAIRSRPRRHRGRQAPPPRAMACMAWRSPTAPAPTPPPRVVPATTPWLTAPTLSPWPVRTTTAHGTNYDTAIDIGNNTAAAAGRHGAYAGGASLIGGADSGTGSNDTAIDIGNNGTKGSRRQLRRLRRRRPT